ncbi:hypothetical protein AB6809_34630 [Paraburkholderia sp. RCC_158]
MKFQKRNCIVEATQWFSPGDHPAVTQRDRVWSVATPDGWYAVRPGDWVITASDGTIYCMQNMLFVDLYEPLSGTYEKPS